MPISSHPILTKYVEVPSVFLLCACVCVRERTRERERERKKRNKTKQLTSPRPRKHQPCEKPTLAGFAFASALLCLVSKFSVGAPFFGWLDGFYLKTLSSKPLEPAYFTQCPAA